MDTGRKGVVLALFALTSVACAGAFAQVIPWGEEKAAPPMPLIFNGRGADRLAAEEVARQDAYRKLVERVYGLTIDARTDVQDLALASRTVDSSLRNELRGMKEVGKKYYDDGRVEAALEITMREVVELVEKTYKEVRKDDRLVSLETFEDIKRETRDKSIAVVGHGALKDSKGLEKVRAMRAAEMDCCERIAARVFGINIAADTTVRDFVLENDSIRSKLEVALLNGVKFTKYEFLDDDTCAATGQMTIRELVEILARTHRRYAKGGKVKLEDIENIETKNRDLVIAEVGQGAVRSDDEGASATTYEPFVERKTVIERVLRQEIIVE